VKQEIGPVEPSPGRGLAQVRLSFYRPLLLSLATPHTWRQASVGSNLDGEGAAHADRGPLAPLLSPGVDYGQLVEVVVMALGIAQAVGRDGIQQCVTDRLLG